MGFKIGSDGYNGSITFLISEEGARIEIYDRESTICVARIELDVQQLAEMLSRRAMTPCDIRFGNLAVVGKKMKVKKFEFEMPEADWKDRKEVAYKTACKVCPEGWIPDDYFGSRDSFFDRDGKSFARVHIRQWTEGN